MSLWKRRRNANPSRSDADGGMRKFRVTIGTETYEVEALDQHLAWQEARDMHREATGGNVALNPRTPLGAYSNYSYHSRSLPISATAMHPASSYGLGGAVGYSQPGNHVLPDDAKVDGEVVGFRTWPINAWALGQLGIQGQPQWNPGVNTAKCGTGNYHLSPDPHCGCGLYAMTRPYQAQGHMQGQMLIGGAVLAWGELCLHPQGFRAQYAKPIILITNENWPASQRAIIKALAGVYGCQLVEEPDLLLAASEHGQLVPDEITPKMGDGEQSIT